MTLFSGKAPKTPDVDSAPQLSPEILEFVQTKQSKVMKAYEVMNDILVGQDEVNKLTLSVLLAGGNGLLLGLPGLGKSMLMTNLGAVLNMKSALVQCTSDTQPGDFVGVEVIEEDLDTGRKSFVVKHGPAYGNNLLFADEVNRASPSAQSGLLQMMQDKVFTIGKETFYLPQLFSVFAAQNPIDQEGTNPLPEAQKDRFLMQIPLTYTSKEQENYFTDRATKGDLNEAFKLENRRKNEGADAVLERKHAENHVDVDAVLEPAELLVAQKIVKGLTLSERASKAIVDTVFSLRPQLSEYAMKETADNVELGPGPRATIAFKMAAKAHAFVSGRLVPSDEDLRAVVKPVLVHRMSAQAMAQYGSNGVQLEDLVERALDNALG